MQTVSWSSSLDPAIPPGEARDLEIAVGTLTTHCQTLKPLVED
jgi:hypothetical protein